MKRIGLYFILKLLFLTNIHAQKSIIQILHPIYIGFNENLDVKSDQILNIPNKKGKRRLRKAQGSRGKLRKIKTYRTKSFCEYDNQMLKKCLVTKSNGEKINYVFEYDEEKKLLVTQQIDNIDTIYYNFSYDSLGRPTQIIKKNRKVSWVKEKANYSKTGKVRIDSYFLNGGYEGYEIYAYELGFLRHIKSISAERKKNEIVINKYRNDGKGTYIFEFKLDRRRNWISKIFSTYLNGKRYKISKSKRKIKYK